MKEFTTVANAEQTTEIVIEKSRFIAAAIHIDSVEQAMEFVFAKRKKYFDATHNCFAYILGDKAKFSDDGEPQGTAGLPILECIKNNGLDCVCVVVTRYFGGIKLGAGGLVRAYSGSCSAVLKQCEKLQMTNCTRAQITVEYTLLKPLRHALQSVAIEEQVFYDDKVRLVYLFSSVSSTTISHIVSQTTLGKAKIEVLEQILCPFNL